jgi:hypothetical protein
MYRQMRRQGHLRTRAKVEATAAVEVAVEAVEEEEDEALVEAEEVSVDKTGKRATVDLES